MPLNEAQGYIRSNLTKEQKREALAAIYGPVSFAAPVMSTQMSASDIERMRTLIAQHDSDHRPGIKEFDLNNPPKVPYVYQELPRLVYHHAKRKHQLAHSEEELAAALEAGWSKEPYAAEAKTDDALTDAESLRELAAAEEKLRSKRK